MYVPLPYQRDVGQWSSFWMELRLASDDGLEGSKIERNPFVVSFPSFSYFS